jgi:hypothetical protein
MTRTTVPPAPVHEDGSLQSGQHEVGGAARDYPSMQSVASAGGVQRTP